MAAAQYGYTGYYKPPKVPTSTIAQAAAGKRTTTMDPFGLLTDTTDSARVARMNATPHVPASTVIPAGTAPGATPFHEGPMIPAPAGPNTAPTPAAAYDIHTDPALQEVDALTGKNDAEAAAAALAQKQAIALNLGDAGLASKLGLGDLVAQAAAANPNSTFAQLGSQHDRKTHDLTEELNKANLLYGGYRINEEDQAAKDFQDAIAQAASGANQSIGQVDSNLAQVMGANQGQRIQALLAAYAGHKTDPGAGGGAGGAGGTDTAPPGPTDPGGPAGGGGLPDAYWQLLALAAAGKKPIGA